MEPKRRLKPAHTDSFLIRIWREEGQAGWKGWIQHTRSGESALVRELEELWAFIERRTGKLDTTARKGLK